MQEMQVWSLGWEDPLQKEMATHSSILPWEIPWTEEPGGLQSVRSKRVRYNLGTKQDKIQSLCRKTIQALDKKEKEQNWEKQLQNGDCISSGRLWEGLKALGRTDQSLGTVGGLWEAGPERQERGVYPDGTNKSNGLWGRSGQFWLRALYQPVLRCAPYPNIFRRMRSTEREVVAFYSSS